jgi:hypothetical protein
MPVGNHSAAAKPGSRLRELDLMVPTAPTPKRRSTIAGMRSGRLLGQMAIRRIIRDGNRASDVVSRMRTLLRKARPATERLDINETIKEIVILTQSGVGKTRWHYGRNWPLTSLR